MKKIVYLTLCVILMLTVGCSQQKEAHSAPLAQSSPPVQSTVPAQSALPAQSTASAQGSETTEAEIPAVTPAGGMTALGPQEAGDDYPYDIAADRKTFDADKIDITVGDKLYMTQINDWYMNFSTYNGKSVVIDGYYMTFDDPYTFVGRKGPTCPYCTGGYVNFEFKSDQDLSELVSLSSWIRVTGILRQGTTYPGLGLAGKPFYYIEAISVEELPEVGVDTITN